MLSENGAYVHTRPAIKKTLCAWKCEKGHFWYETIENRAHYQECHICQAPKKVTEVYNLQYLRPDLTNQLHPTKNKSVIPHMLAPHSSKVMTWICDKGHEWEAKVWARSAGQGCTVCRNRKVGKDNNLAVLRPDLAAEWDHEENGDLKPSQVVLGSSKRVAWKCSNGHKWSTRISNRTNLESGCRKCSRKNAIKVSKDNSFAGKFPELVKQFHPTLNGNISLYELLPTSNVRFWWKCEKGHEWQALLATRSYGFKCPECNNKRVGLDNNLAVLYPDLAAE